MKTKKLSKKRGLTIPLEIASELALYGGEAIDISVKGDCIVIKKHTPVCRFCGSFDRVKAFESIECCPDCAFEFKEVICDE